MQKETGHSDPEFKDENNQKEVIEVGSDITVENVEALILAYKNKQKIDRHDGGLGIHPLTNHGKVRFCRWGQSFRNPDELLPYKLEDAEQSKLDKILKEIEDGADKQPGLESAMIPDPKKHPPIKRKSYDDGPIGFFNGKVIYRDPDSQPTYRE